MARFVQIAVAILALTVAVSVGALAYYGCHALQQWAAVGTATTTAATDLDATIKRLNGPTGTITEADKLLLALKSTTVHADMVIAHEDKQLATYDEFARKGFGDFERLVGQAGGTLDATTQTAQAATKSIGSLDSTIITAQPLLVSMTATAQSSTAAIDALNARINDPHVASLMLHLDATTGHIDGITSDAEKVTHHYEHAIVDPQKTPWWVKLTPSIVQEFYKVAEAHYAAK